MVVLFNIPERNFMKKIIFFVAAFAMAGITESLRTSCPEMRDEVAQRTICSNCQPECSDCECTECVVPQDECVMPEKQITPAEYEMCKAMYEAMQKAYLEMNIHSMIEQAFQDVVDMHPEAVEIAKKYYGVDINVEDGVFRALATPVYFINY